MKVLWLCNVMLPVIAAKLNLEASNKEGWLSGLSDVVLKKKRENGIELTVAFPAPESILPEGGDVCRGAALVDGVELPFYGFREDTSHPESYDAGLEDRLKRILEGSKPDVVHCFGTEYPHTLAMCRTFSQKDRLLISIQGLCAVYANTYLADMPAKVVHSVTLRDFLKQDSILQQQRKFEQRGRMEKEAVRLTGNVSGRTEWDRYYTKEWNPQASYYPLNETLRPDFYEENWKYESCIPHSIFLSQGDYPVKGLHYMLKALPLIREKYPDARVYVAGNRLVGDGSIKKRLKISAYGKYLRRLIAEGHLWDSVCFLGKLNAGQMKQQYLRSHLFVCCSTIENSPNSLGEAMLLGMPCVSADVGGIPSIFTNRRDGILYEGYRTPKNGFDNVCNCNGLEEENLEIISRRLANAVLEMWEDLQRMEQYCKNARNHAEKNHNRAINYEKMQEIYSEISGENR